MANTHRYRSTPADPGPVAPDGERAATYDAPGPSIPSDSAGPEKNPDFELKSVLARAEATLGLVSGWLGNLQTLIHLELQRTITASKRIIALNLLLLPLAVTFVVSLCAGAGLGGYYFFQSVYAGFGIFLLSQLLVLTGILLYQKRLRSMLGFEETRHQVREALDDVAETFK
ncbi:hypothetical protein [Microbulbifer yueqingensis]|uniref:Holin-X, holin superfamily III n=1 Tax=Microbulbifer yueqingensis TaxID=658219 RepID=A0A1G8VWB8_9GAMM|nr:hypothetical protein [Microbulbifer yueqingensis]SDJ70236.1 hypothetical protein SAMN05216212_0759 [Microbulbifer yueqingensis]